MSISQVERHRLQSACSGAMPETLSALDEAAGFDAAAAVADLAQTISVTYDQAEVQAISDKVDELLASLRTAGLLAS